MFDIVDTAFCYERGLIVCSFLHDLSKGKGSTLQLICNAHTVFCRADSFGSWDQYTNNWYQFGRQVIVFADDAWTQ